MADIDNTEELGPKAAWYVAHTYSGYENKVKIDLEKTIQNRHMEDRILEVSIPMEDVVETREDGTKRTVSRKMFPGYVLVHMIKDDETWYVIRNTRGVTGFVGPDGKETPLSDEEVARMGLGRTVVKANFAVGDYIQVISGPMAGMEGPVQEVNENKQEVTIMVEMFGRETPLALNFKDIKKM